MRLMDEWTLQDVSRQKRSCGLGLLSRQVHDSHSDEHAEPFRVVPSRCGWRLPDADRAAGDRRGQPPRGAPLMRRRIRQTEKGLHPTRAVSSQDRSNSQSRRGPAAPAACVSLPSIRPLIPQYSTAASTRCSSLIRKRSTGRPRGGRCTPCRKRAHSSRA